MLQQMPTGLIALCNPKHYTLNRSMWATRKEATGLRIANIAFNGLRSYNEGVKYRIREGGTDGVSSMISAQTHGGNSK